MEEFGNFTGSLSSKINRLSDIVDDMPPPSGRRAASYQDAIHDLIIRGREALRGDPRGTEHAGRVWVFLTWVEASMAQRAFPGPIIKALRKAGFEPGI